MGFPSWTLWGMGLTALGALIAVALAFLLLSPRFVAGVGLGNRRLDSRVRTLVGIGLALILLAFGFFLAGVPLGAGDDVTAPEPTPAGAVEGSDRREEATEQVLSQVTDEPLPTNTAPAFTTRTTGAFANPLATGTAASSATGSEAQVTEGVEATIAVETPTANATGIIRTATPGARSTQTATPTASATPRISSQGASSPTASPTSTSTPTSEPTLTPTPTVTPTPIEGETATIATSGSTLWVRRTPGGQPLALVRDRDVVILSSGHAHQGGVLWREVRTVTGVLGWVQEEFLSYNEGS